MGVLALAGDLDPSVEAAFVGGAAASVDRLGSEEVVAAAADGGVDLAEVCGYDSAWHIRRLLHVERGDTIAVRIVPTAGQGQSTLGRGALKNIRDERRQPRRLCPRGNRKLCVDRLLELYRLDLIIKVRLHQKGSVRHE